jgi:predicted O-methyltransferase YrrM
MHDGKVAWDLGTLTGVSAAVLSEHMKVVTVERETSLVKFARKHLPKNVRVVEAEIAAFLRNMAAHGKQADFIFMDLDKPLYQECYEMIMADKLLKPGGILVADNVLYRGLTVQHRQGEMPEVSEKTSKNAACLDGFLQLVRKDMLAGHLTSLLMPVRDGMLAVKLAGGGDMSCDASTASTVE